MNISDSNLNSINSNVTYTSKASNVKPEPVEVSTSSQGKSREDGKYNAYISRGMEKVIQDQVDTANKSLELQNIKCEYRYVKEANRIAIRVVDEKTDQVIKEIPSEDFLKMAEQLQKLTGMLIDARS